MTAFTVDDLRAILTAVAGQDEENDLSGDIATTTFDDLGYDSLALMEMAARLAQDYDVYIDDDEVVELKTPDDVITAVNRVLGGAQRG
jgi:act minimal PKS acyl carrier protein